ncbi:MAG: hypothetical protein KBD53_02480 [Candidatus Omnitrophica bacterium]|nr:hypothetical protein [Candidatus Omnitrophota bacterium]
MKKVLLVGCGAEIGATLLSMNDPKRDGFAITAILTHTISGDPKHPQLKPLDSLYARIVLAQPHMLDKIIMDYEKDALILSGFTVKIFWGNSHDFDLNQFKEKFDVCIFATSKKEIGEDKIIKRFETIAKYVIGVSEAKQIPALYANLIDLPERFLPNPPQPAKREKTFCVGSCQSNGWHGPLRALLELAEESKFKTFEILGMEVDIIHPDTPTGRLGTKSIEARNQDPRDNFRPSFSQVEMSMKILFPSANNINTISLRTLTQPPGYQITRFFFRYTISGKNRLTRDAVVQSFDRTAQRFPDTLRMAHIPLGSRGFEMSESSAIVLASERFLRFYDDPFKTAQQGSVPVSELIVQAYVHNVRGYCRSVLNLASYLSSGKQPKIFQSSTVKEE